MRVARLALLDFRSWAQLELSFEPGVNALVGPNGQGKTNIVEAVGYLSTLSSHRVATDAPLVRSGAARSVVRVEVDRDGRSTLLEVEINPGKANRARINRAPVSRARELLGGLRTVLFAPEDLALVRGDPSERRRFLDDLLVARQPRWAGVRSDYDRVLKQRNALLKTAAAARRGGGADMRTLDVWDSHLAAAGSELLSGRLQLTASLRDRVQDAAAIVGGIDAGALAISYRSTIDPAGGPPAGGSGAGAGAFGSGEQRDVLAAALLAELARRRPEEIERGTSLVGPHRDDLTLELGSLPARGYASHGEGWSVALALRLASFHLLRAEGAEPVLILDDVFAELDAGRRRRLADHVSDVEQVLISAAVAADVPEQLTGARFDVVDGCVTRVL